MNFRFPLFCTQLTDSIPFHMLTDAQVNHKSKVFVAIKSATPIDSKKFLKIVERSHHIISLYFSLPKTDKGNHN